MRADERRLEDAFSGADLAEQMRAVQLACRQQRDDLPPMLIALLASAEIGYFVEECLPQFGGRAIQPLKALIGDPQSPPLARRRAAGVIALLGDRDAIPILLEAVQDPEMNQAYLRRLVELAPDALVQRVMQVLQERRDEILGTEDPHRASYFAALLHVLGDLGVRHQASDTLVRFQQHGRDWRIRQAVNAALAVA